MFEKFIDSIQKKHCLTAAEISSRTDFSRLNSSNFDLAVLYHTTELELKHAYSHLPIVNSNSLVIKTCRSFSASQSHIPFYVGLNCTDPNCYFPSYLKELKSYGIEGIQNYPSVGMIDGRLRYNLERVGLGYMREVDTLHMASFNGFNVIPFVFGTQDALILAKMGYKILILHMGFELTGLTYSEEKFIYSQKAEQVCNDLKSLFPQVLLLAYFEEPVSERIQESVLLKVPQLDGIYRSIIF